MPGLRIQNFTGVRKCIHMTKLWKKKEESAVCVFVSEQLVILVVMHIVLIVSRWHPRRLVLGYADIVSIFRKTCRNNQRYDDISFLGHCFANRSQPKFLL